MLKNFRRNHLMPFSICKNRTNIRNINNANLGSGQGVGENVFGVKLLGAKAKSAPSGYFLLLWLPQPGREAKENIIFFVANHSTALSDWIAEGHAGLRRLAAARCLLRAFPQNTYF